MLPRRLEASKPSRSREAVSDRHGHGDQGLSNTGSHRSLEILAGARRRGCGRCGGTSALSGAEGVVRVPPPRCPGPTGETSSRHRAAQVQGS